MANAETRLSFEELEGALEALVGERVAVRIVEPVEPERLVAAVEGVLGSPSNEKAPTRFWPLDDGLGPRTGAAEAFGFLIHGDAFRGAGARAGGTVIVISQGAVLINIRRL